MAVIPTGYVQVNFRFDGPALLYPAECTIGLADIAYAGTPDDLAEDMKTAFDTTLLDNLTNGVSLREVTAKYGPNDLGPVGTWVGDAPGSVATAGASSAVSYLVQKITASGGRANRGRMYLPGVSEASIGSDGDLDNTFQATMQSDATAFLTAITGFDTVPVILHGPDSPVSIPTPITSLTVDGRVATQRRRQRR